MREQELIIIRGNSGSEKGAVTERLQEEIDGTKPFEDQI